MKTQKAWTPAEASAIYHLLLMGYNNKEIIALCKAESGAGGSLYDRSPDSISGKCSEVRKWISKGKGYVVSNYDISDRVHKSLTKAAKLPVSEYISLLVPSPPRQFIPMVVKPGPYTAAQCPPPIKPQFTRECTTTAPPIYNTATDQTHPPAANIIDVMRMAKELGAIEVEYSGVKIKF